MRTITKNKRGSWVKRGQRQVVRDEDDYEEQEEEEAEENDSGMSRCV